MTDLDSGADLHDLMDRALSDLPTPTDRLREGALRHGRPLRRRRRMVTGLASVAVVAATAAVLTRLGKDASYARGHRETSTTGKIDPSFVDLDAMRADVAAAMGGAPPTGPTGTPFQVYAPDVNVRPTPATTGAAVGNLGAPGTVYVECQTIGETVTANGYTNNRWAKISSPIPGYVSNVFIQGPASLPVPTC